MNGHQIVATFDSRMEAELARTLLADEGIEARVVVDDAGGMHPELSRATGGVGLSVPDADAEPARARLEEVEAGFERLRDGTGREIPSSSGTGASRRRFAALTIAIAVVVLLFVTFEAVRQGGLLEL